MKYDVIIVGAGFAGSVMAERFANDNKKVLVIDKRNHIAGNMYDYKNNDGILIHKYGPHLFHTIHEEVYDYLSNFTEWFEYEHRVLGFVDDKLVPIPFNLTSLEEVYEKAEADHLKELLVKKFGMENKVPILRLKEEADEELKNLADYIYENVFLYYTMKQWGLTPEQIDPSVTNRVPVYISRDDRYFQDTYQYMPVNGYTTVFDNMLNHENITIKLNCDAKDILEFDYKNSRVLYNGQVYDGKIIYTGPIDELFDYKYGVLPYRSLEFEFKTIDVDQYQPVGTVNYPTKEHPFTRITEFKHITNQVLDGKTTFMKEFPHPYHKDADIGNIPYYAILKEENLMMYSQYKEAASKFEDFYLLGRLAEYQYYNMDKIIQKALQLFEEIK